MKKTAAVIAGIMCLSTTAYAAEDITVFMDGERLSFEQPPIIRDNSTLVPFRAIFERLGMEVEWYSAERRVTADNGVISITLQIDNPEMLVNGERVSLNTPPVIYNDYTMVPLRAVSEAAGAKVDWNGETREITIISSDKKNSQTNDIQSLSLRILELTNAERLKEGLGPLEWDSSLASLAQEHCEDMINRGYFNHETPDGQTSFDRMKNAGIEYWLAGENIAAGQSTPEKTVAAWMKSEYHRENILNPSYTSMGAGFAKGGEHGYYWTQEFALLK